MGEVDLLCVLTELPELLGTDLNASGTKGGPQVSDVGDKFGGDGDSVRAQKLREQYRFV